MPNPIVRPPVCADDRWYPSDAGDLQALVDRLLAQVSDEPDQGDLIGLISPHAGYAYAGPTAAHAYKQLDGRAYKRVILLGPNHYAGYYADLGPQATSGADFYQTPFGKVEIDREAIREIGRQVPLDLLRGDHEHSLEMQLPFLQRQLGSDFKLIPLMLAQPFYVFGPSALRSCQQLAAALSPLLDANTLLVASSDLSHLTDYEEVKRADAGLEELVSEYDIDRLVEYMINKGECRACGDVAIVTLLLTARGRGANRVRVLARTNSADVIGAYEPGQYTVGYMAAAVFRQPEENS